MDFFNMEIKLGEDKKEWDSWLLNQGSFEFLQSWEWGDFQKEAGFEVVRLQVVEDGVVQMQVQGFVHDLKIGKYLYVPRLKAEGLRLKDLFEFFKKEKYIFCRLETLNKLSLTPYSLLLTPPRQPQHTLILNLEKSENELLSAMHSKTRYNIRLAEKKGVEIKQEKNIDVFWKLNEETIGRDDFKSHGKDYYEKMLQHNFCHQLTTYFEGQSIASNIFIHFGKRFTYLHGSSSNEYRNLMAPYLLQWKGIQMAKELDCTEYDFWGIAPDFPNRHFDRPKEVEESRLDQKKRDPSTPLRSVRDDVRGPRTCFHNLCWDVTHPWTGVTRFKAGFGGERKDYPEAVDVVLKKLRYKVYLLIKKIFR